MSNLRSIYRPNTLISSLISCSRSQFQLRFVCSLQSPKQPVSPKISSPFLIENLPNSLYSSSRFNSRRTITKAANWSSERSPYETLELARDANEEMIKSSYRRLAKYYHPDVYDGRGTLEEGETAEARFIKIQAAYELLMDDEKRQNYDRDNRVNPMKASQAWMEWLMKKRKAFDQRGDMAIAAWAEQQQREMNLRARRLSRSKVDPEEERRILAKEKQASKEYFSATLKRHTLVLKKRDLMRKKKAEDEKNKVIAQLLAAEGLELDTENEDESV